MGPQPDPYRTLGLQRGASEAEVKAAYRRLVKTYHPDTAGEKAIPRFLAIQAAYDALTGPGRSRAGATPKRPAEREPWRADPERARATRPGTRARSGGTRQGGQARTRQGTQSQTSDTQTGRTGGTRRPRRDTAPGRATPGSTTYDTAEHEPFNPEWSGASWYGTTSGTYWTINPKEYADPRKHGPEYQARARRTWAGATGSTPVGETTAEQDDMGQSEPDATDASTDDTAATRRQSRYRSAEEPRVPPTAPGNDSFTRTSATSDGNLLSALPLPPGFPTRAAIALLGWPPLGFAFATFVSEASGCGRFAASCVDTFDVGTWVGQLAIIGLLLALPRLASISAIGTLVMLGAAVPAAVLLSATGGAREREAAATFLTIFLVTAYVVGVVIAVARTARTMRA